MSPENAEYYDDERHVGVEWPSALIETTPAALAARHMPYRVGSSFKVPAEAEDAFRGFRERFWTETNGSNFITAAEGDQRFFLFMRDTLPFEDPETGLLEVGPYSQGDCVGGFGVDFAD